MADFTDSQRAVLRALADNLVPALRRDADPSGFWAASGSALGADAGVAQALRRCRRSSARSAGAARRLHVLGFATVAALARAAAARRRADGRAPAAGMARSSR